MAPQKDRFEAYMAEVARAKEPMFVHVPGRQNPCVRCVNARRDTAATRFCKLSGRREEDVEWGEVRCPNSQQLELVKQCPDCTHATQILDCELTGRYQPDGLGEHYLDCPKWTPRDNEASPKTH
ncbi:MAG: hypothetical protein LBM75_09255 [Myxococcales bacterium]|jgi:hypothetical protein|nr:hypothetical protein [Myxococcales bacterium]